MGTSWKVLLTKKSVSSEPLRDAIATFRTAPDTVAMKHGNPPKVPPVMIIDENCWAYETPTAKGAS
jgi:hypothetical protein